MQNYIISHELAQAVLDYLVSRPWKESNDMIQRLRNLSPAPPVPSAVEKVTSIEDRLPKA